MNHIVEAGSDRGIREVQKNLRELESGEWRRWVFTLVVMMVLTAGIFVLVHASPNTVDVTSHLANVDFGLVAMILIYDIFLVYQQFVAVRLRRKLAIQIATIATLEVTSPLPSFSPSGGSERRHSRRSWIDTLIRVDAVKGGPKKHLHGQLCNMSHDGIGAIIPEILNVGDEVRISFDSTRGNVDHRLAVVKHRRGFLYGFEYSNKNTSGRIVDIAQEEAPQSTEPD